MRIRPRGLVLLAVQISLISTSPLPAQSYAPGARLYRLERASTFQRGCFAPCLCPVLETAPLAGTFRLTLASVGDVFDFYEVSRVAWKAQRSNADAIPITGSGHYKVSEIAGLQQMSLTLGVDQNVPERFDSGEVPIPVRFPRIDLSISIHGGYCHDTVMELHARPAMRLDTDRNRLSWVEEPDEAAPWDVVYGDLGTLRASGGDFAAAATGCVVRDYWDTTLAWSADPAPGEGVWYLGRPGDGTYADGEPEQVGNPDAAIGGLCD